MMHIDEGTIHAWLDGQLDAGRSREIESHVATCPECSDAVAEARGLIAGSSRVLNALDDVPGGVVPTRARPPRRKWQAAKWVTGIAAALILAVSLTEIRGGAHGASQLETTPSVTTNRPSAAPTTAAATPLANSTRAPALGGPTSSTTSPLAHTMTAAAPPSRSAQLSASTGASPALDVAAERKGVAGAGAGMASAQTANAEPSRSERSFAAAVPAPAMSISPSAPRAAAATDAAEMTGSSLVGGCYVVDATSARVLESTAAAAPAAAQKAARARVAASADMMQRAAPTVIRLDTTRATIGYVVRLEPADTTAGWWRVEGDSARVHLQSGTAFNVALSNRTPCP